MKYFSYCAFCLGKISLYLGEIVKIVPKLSSLAPFCPSIIKNANLIPTLYKCIRFRLYAELERHAGPERRHAPCATPWPATCKVPTRLPARRPVRLPVQPPARHPGRHPARRPHGFRRGARHGALATPGVASWLGRPASERGWAVSTQSGREGLTSALVCVQATGRIEMPHG